MQRIRQGAVNSLKLLGLLFFTAMALMVTEQCSTPAFAQQGIIQVPEPTIEEQLSVEGPIDMNMVWDYIKYAFGDPFTAPGVLIFEADTTVDGDLFHIQIADANGNVWHVDVELDEMSPGGATSDDGLFRFFWFCYNEDIKDSLIGCTLPLASWVVGYDAEMRIAFRWPRRIQ